MPPTLQDSGLKVVINPSGSGRAVQWSFRKCVVISLAALSLSAGLGAWAALNLAPPSGVALAANVVPAAAAGSANSANSAVSAPTELEATVPEMVREAAYARENIALLAARVGALQARALALESQTEHLARAALTSNGPAQSVAFDFNVASKHALAEGLAPEAEDYLAQAETNGVLDLPTAETLGRQVDALQLKFSQNQDVVSALDTAVSRQAAERARWPSVAPIANFPYLSSSYGWRRNPVTGRQSMHEGLDFAAPRGTPIEAAASGIVVEAKYVSGYGNLVEVDHGGGLVTRYAHASRLHVQQGDLVERGQLLAQVGSTGRSTGPHLHFEVRLADQPLDPRLFLDDPTQPSGASFASLGQNQPEHP